MTPGFKGAASPRFPSDIENAAGLIIIFFVESRVSSPSGLRQFA
jgi:hypothetical protein